MMKAYLIASLLFTAVSIMNLDWARGAGEAAVLSGIGLACTHLQRLFMHARGWQRLRLWARIPRLLAACFILSIPAAFVVSSLGLAAWQTP